MSEPYWTPLGATGYVPQGALVTALPGSPVDGQECVLTDSLTAPTYAWHLRYVAAKATNKWVFLGGSPAVVVVTTNEQSVSATYAVLATAGPSFTVPVAGDYLVTVSFRLVIQVGDGDPFMSYDVGATPASDAWGAGGYMFNNTSRAYERAYRHLGLAAATALVSKYRRGAITSANFDGRHLIVQPLAVGG